MTTSKYLRLLLLSASLLFGALSAVQPASAEAYQVPETAYGAGPIHEGDVSVESRLIVDATQVAPGDTIRVGVAFKLASEWHIYWKYPGDAGVPTHIEWSADQMSFGELQWAAPQVFAEMDGEQIVYGYDNEVILYSEATVAKDATGSITLQANVDYLACSNLCMPGHSNLSRTIPVGDSTILADTNLIQDFAKFGKRVPRKAEDLGLETKFHYSQTPLRPNDEFNVLVELVECQEKASTCLDLKVRYDDLEHAFIPDIFSIPEVRVTALEKHPDAAHGWLLNIHGKLPADAEESRDILSGVLEFEASDGSIVPVYIRDEFERGAPDDPVEEMPVPTWDNARIPGVGSTPALSNPKNAEPGAATTPDDSEEPLSLAWVLVLAFVGGIILNLMPCVFPVLALKVSSFANIVHESKRGIVTHGMAYTGGIIGSMMVLASVVIGLRVAGTQVGWGFQFQQPHFLAGLIVILVLFALNLFGVFEVSMNAQNIHEKAQESSGIKRSVWEGVLAVILATPCSAPFLGTAVGFALASGPLTIIAVFAALGLGLAAPMVALTLMPGWAKVLPKPGMWMAHLKTFLGFALLGSAIWIIWLLGRQAGVDAMASVLMFAGTLGIAAWLFGLVQFASWTKRKAMTVALALSILGVAGYYSFPLKIERTQARAANTATSTVDEIQWQDWSEEAVQAAVAEGRPVFVDFGADWCLTCQANMKTAIDTAPVREAIVKYNVAPFYADWTNPDEKIRLKLAEHGKAGVPFYLIYSPNGSPKGKPMPEVLTPTMLVDAFKEAAQ
ncbi:protein-disulfide reductase DsbD family protein [Bradymonas sediminis]|uniref:Thiol:disulfide interchange protein n=1 Tax=Bradymonas sediminis TaxID=1548548 RepID=A0A2Z4FGK9_9DELT|nr:thioredoxin family protein [Bradymonas sediminis]AWV88122.1 thiol:disulfide interchange protein [Bradymonas sediminis]TDP77245.1 thiol:disulfide interchange protein DsbD [Bradymonas sediminis]